MNKHTPYDKLTKKYQNVLLKSLADLVAIPSVFDSSTVDEKNPFGEPVSQCLLKIEEMAKKDGFKVTNYRNMILEIICGDEKKENITILAHADVVPAGKEGWEHDPFSLVEKKGVLYGRGVADDKGPLLASYYALKALRDHHQLPDNYCVRFLVGGNEENGSKCVKYYFEKLKKKQPAYAFSPDSAFPLIYGEKGIFNFTVKEKIKIPDLISINGGVASNSVIDECTVTMNINEIFTNYVMEHYSRKQAAIFTNKDITRIIFYGKAAHGAAPDLGINSGIIALEALADCYHYEPLLSLLKKIKPTDGKGLNASGKSKDMGTNTLNIGLIFSSKNQLIITGNFRYVNTCKYENLVKKIKNAFSNSMSLTITPPSPLLYYPLDSKIVSTLSSVYALETGDKEHKPVTTGGGTYAKEAKNCVAFGMTFPGFDYHMHSPGECVPTEHLFKAMSVYAHAIIELGKLIDANKI